MAELFVVEPIHPLTKAREVERTLRQTNKQSTPVTSNQ